MSAPAPSSLARRVPAIRALLARLTHATWELSRSLALLAFAPASSTLTHPQALTYGGCSGSSSSTSPDSPSGTGRASGGVKSSEAVARQGSHRLSSPPSAVVPLQPSWQEEERQRVLARYSRRLTLCLEQSLAQALSDDLLASSEEEESPTLARLSSASPASSVPELEPSSAPSSPSAATPVDLPTSPELSSSHRADEVGADEVEELAAFLQLEVAAQSPPGRPHHTGKTQNVESLDPAPQAKSTGEMPEDDVGVGSGESAPDVAELGALAVDTSVEEEMTEQRLEATAPPASQSPEVIARSADTSQPATPTPATPPTAFASSSAATLVTEVIPSESSPKFIAQHQRETTRLDEKRLSKALWRLSHTVEREIEQAQREVDDLLAAQEEQPAASSGNEDVHAESLRLERGPFKTVSDCHCSATAACSRRSRRTQRCPSPTEE